MKLRNWEINEALKAGDILAALNAAADEFGLPRFTDDSPVLKDIIVHDAGSPARQQIRISCGGVVHVWDGGHFYTRLSQVNGTWAIVWAVKGYQALEARPGPKAGPARS